jgi:hypothetical protein
MQVILEEHKWPDLPKHGESSQMRKINAALVGLMPVHYSPELEMKFWGYNPLSQDS